MNHARWGFTIVELLISVVVIAILASLSVVAYNGIVTKARTAAAQSQLHDIGIAMELARQETGAYPAELPESVRGGGSGSGSTGTGGTGGASGTPTEDGQPTLAWSGVVIRYENLTPVQNGVLAADICQELIDEGLGRGVNQGGATQNYITGCGNWNDDSMQVTAWDSRVWRTPVSSQQLLSYANNFTTSDTWNAAQINVVKNFYIQLVERHQARGGTFPLNSFWDSWATPQNGGTIKEALPEDVEEYPGYCAEITVPNATPGTWHINETNIITEGACG